MKKLYLKLNARNLHSLGFDIVWENEDFEFKNSNDLGIFDVCDCVLQDDRQGRLVIAASNTDDREISGEHEFLEIEFEWKGRAYNNVEFTVENISAKNSSDEDVMLIIYPVDYKSDENTIDFVWR